MNIICTAAAEHIGKKLALDHGFKVTFVDKNKDGKRFFPEGEVYARLSGIDSLVGETVVLHCGSPNPNDGLVELEQVLEILRNSRAKPVKVFFTYFPYGKQDRISLTGETNAAENLIKKLVNYYGVQTIFTVDAHFFKREWVGKYPIINISTVDLLKQAALQDHSDLIFLAPDKGGQKRTGLKGTEKTRLDSYTDKIQSDEEFKTVVRGKRIGAIDDLLETGGTLARFSEECLNCGASDTAALITHIVMAEGLAMIRSKYSKIYFTNTIDREGAKVDVTALIAHTLLT